MVFLSVRPQVITHDVGGKFVGQTERRLQRDPAFRTVGNWYHYDFHARYSVQARHRGRGTVAEFHYINRGMCAPVEAEV